MGARIRTATVDWPNVIDTILRNGFTRRHIAEKVGVHVNTLQGYYYGYTSEPCYSVGVELLKLREQAAGQ